MKKKEYIVYKDPRALRCILQQVLHSDDINSYGSPYGAFLVPPLEEKRWRDSMEDHNSIFDELYPQCTEEVTGALQRQCNEWYDELGERLVRRYIHDNIQDVKLYAARVAEKLEDQAEHADEKTASRLRRSALAVRNCMSRVRSQQQREADMAFRGEGSFSRLGTNVGDLVKRYL